jgi:hypothetical protein
MFGIRFTLNAPFVTVTLIVEFAGTGKPSGDVNVVGFVIEIGPLTVVPSGA